MTSDLTADELRRFEEGQTGDKRAECRIYVACLASYNNGVLYGRWIDVDGKDAGELQAEVNAMLRGSRFPNVTRVQCADCGHIQDDWTAREMTRPDATCDECGGDLGEPFPSAEEFAIHDHEGFGRLVAEPTYEAPRGKETAPAQYEEGAYSVPAPGGNARETVTMERLDEAGAVVTRSTLPTDGKRAVPWKKDAIARAVGPVAKVKRAPKPKPAMSDREAIAHYCEARRTEIEAEQRAAAKAVAGFAVATAALTAPEPSNVVAGAVAGMSALGEEAPPYIIGRAKYAKGQMAVRCTAPGPYKDRAQRLIGDGLNCRWSGRERAYIASPSKVAKFERLYAAGLEASSITGKLYDPERPRDDLTVAEALATAAPAPAPETREEHEAPAEADAPACAPAAPAEPVAAISEGSNGLEEAGEVIGALLADLLRRVAELEAAAKLRANPVTAPSRECDPPSAETDAAPLPADPRARALRHARAPKSRRSPARERLIRSYLTMRRRRDRERLLRDNAAADRASRFRVCSGQGVRRIGGGGRDWGICLNAGALERARPWWRLTDAKGRRRTFATYEEAEKVRLGLEISPWPHDLADLNGQRSAARERLLRRYLAMRQRREFDRTALLAAGEYVRQADAERDAAKVAAAPKPQHVNPPEEDKALVARIHHEQVAARQALNEANNRADALQRSVDRLADEVQVLSSRAHRAEAALRLERAGALPRIAHAGTPAARVSFQLPARMR
jgi:hypothetical protein